jgi:N-acetylmuramoyl-L-alanine amidase CwlA
MTITQKYLPTNTKRRAGIPISGVKFIVAHDTGNDNSTALQNINYYIKSANEMEASAHAFVDDTGVIECIPLTEKAYHVRRIITVDNMIYGGDSIDWSIGVELCFFSQDSKRTKIAYNNYVEYIKGLCQKYGLNPLTGIIGHYTLDPTRRTDPLNAFQYIGKTWEQFLQDVVDQGVPISPKSTILNKMEELKKLIEML